jgi:hypothetical protein
MKWGKIVLLFQAVITLILGIIFFAQVITIEASKISELQSPTINTSEEATAEPITLKERYASAAYVLLFVSLMELIIITKLLT